MESKRYFGRRLTVEFARARITNAHPRGQADWAAEVSPHPEHFLSIGHFESQADIKVGALDADIMQFARNERELELFHFIYSAGQLTATRPRTSLLVNVC
ncbi:hypothetical protein [Bradyrhizobium sp. DASA03120]|uniref:hypothetical protein n=1 Tax=Bradyrhizobium sp. SMVTL-02 TaxID=3395917 RepID=UPI003F7132F3